MESRRVCPYCGAWIDEQEVLCPLCWRSVGASSAAAAGLEGGDSRWISQWVPAQDLLKHSTGVRGALYLGTGLLFVVGYPWLVAALGSARGGSVARELLLALAWLSPEIYLVVGLVWVAHLANANRRVSAGLMPAGVALLLQLMVLPVAAARAPAASYTVTLFGLQGAVLMWGAPLALFALGSIGISLLAAWMPRVVPGKFARVIGPQLGCLSGLVVALLLPTWGGLAMMQFSLDLGFPTIWVDVVAVFVFTFFALLWFRPED